MNFASILHHLGHWSAIGNLLRIFIGIHFHASSNDHDAPTEMNLVCNLCCVCTSLLKLSQYVTMYEAKQLLFHSITKIVVTEGCRSNLIPGSSFSGITIKLCTFEDADRMTVRTEDKTFYTEDDFRDFLSRRGWTLLREYSGYRVADTLDDLRPGAIYQGMRSLVD